MTGIFYFCYIFIVSSHMIFYLLKQTNCITEFQISNVRMLFVYLLFYFLLMNCIKILTCGIGCVLDAISNRTCYLHFFNVAIYARNDKRKYSILLNDNYYYICIDTHIHNKIIFFTHNIFLCIL